MFSRLRRLRQDIALFLLVSLPLFAMAQDVPFHDYHVNWDVTYSGPDWPQPLRGDLYVPEGQGPFATVLVVHGGSWQRGDKGDMADICRDLARHGYAAFTVNYRLAPRYRYPAPILDLQLALRWLHGHSTEYHLDPARTGAWGYSAGAHLVALLATLHTGDALAAPDIQLQAVVSGGTPADLRKWPHSPLVGIFIGKNGIEAPALYAEASPVTHVSAASPPFYLYHGSVDTLVEPDQATDLQASLKAAGVPVQLYWLEGHGHVYTALFPGAAIKGGLDFLDAHLQSDDAVAKNH
jgi:acetyl esterase/lipase